MTAPMLKHLLLRLVQPRIHFAESLVIAYDRGIGVSGHLFRQYTGNNVVSISKGPTPHVTNLHTFYSTRLLTRCLISTGHI
jgi:hypothetical protein